MKRLLLALFLLVGLAAYGQTVVEVAAPLVQWDAPTTKTDGTPIVGTVTYEMAMSATPVADRNPAAQAETTYPAWYPTLGAATYAVAIRTKVVNGAVTEYSDWLWSDQEGAPAPWVVKKPAPPAPKPGKPRNARVGE